VIGRGVEDALLSALVAHAFARRGCSQVVGIYASTAKNAMVKDFYASRGFVPGGETADGGRWEFVAGGEPLASPDWITLREGEPAHAAR
jgi:predicted enzyme involved in methoxymalonyl-ACP biosynthesis